MKWNGSVTHVSADPNLVVTKLGTGLGTKAPAACTNSPAKNAACTESNTYIHAYA